MTPTATPKPGGKKLGGLPVWAWAAAAALGVVVGIVVLRRRAHSAGDPSAQATYPSTSMAGAAPTTAGGDAAPADSLAAGTLQLLAEINGAELDALVTQGQTLGAVTIGAQNALASIAAQNSYLASTGMSSALSLAASAVAASNTLAGQVVQNYKPAEAPPAPPPPPPPVVQPYTPAPAPTTGPSVTPTQPISVRSGSATVQVGSVIQGSSVPTGGVRGLTAAQQAVRQASGRGHLE